jgi:D-3-phosphoglycerate dehydrogenase
VAADEEFAVSGTTTGRDDEPRLVRALGYDVEIALEPLMLFVVNDDRPGRIGRLGTILGEEEINIANMAVSRNRPRSRALMVLTLDTPIPPQVLERIRSEPGLLDPRAIALERGEEE